MIPQSSSTSLGLEKTVRKNNSLKRIQYSLLYWKQCGYIGHSASINIAILSNVQEEHHEFYITNNPLYPNVEWAHTGSRHGI